jgi:hypothetical protein
MKSLPIVILAFSFSALAQNKFDHMPKGALKKGTLASAVYQFKTSDESNVEITDKVVMTEIANLKRQKNSGYSHNVGKYDSEATGRITDIKTSFNIRVKLNSQNYDCLMESALLSDSFDYIGYDDARYTCEVHTSYRAYKIILRDYSENKNRNGKAIYELGLAAIEKGFSGGKKTLVLAEINAK